jgi:hypothetical protein
MTVGGVSLATVTPFSSRSRRPRVTKPTAGPRCRREEEAIYVSKRGRLSGVLVDVDRYAELIERLEYVEDSLAALQARDERDATVPWTEVRE